MGIGNNTHVVFYYEGLGTLTDATTGFWIMEYLGHDKAHVLNGGIDAWRKAGNRLDNKPVKLKTATFKANVVPARYSRHGRDTRGCQGRAAGHATPGLENGERVPR